jgi:tetratricopeptide (TPR) repeat protein
VHVNRKRRGLACAAVVAAGLWAYHDSFHGPFVLDDLLAIAQNPTLATWRAALHPTAGAGITVEGRPLLNLSFALNHALGGLAVEGYHALNLAIHLAAALTLFGLVRTTAAPVGVALAAALLWVAHPLQTESVTYIAQRAESLAGLFSLLTLYCFCRAARASGATRSIFSALSVVSCLCGMMTKETVAVAPLLVLLYDRAYFAGSFRQAWRMRRGYYCGLAATWIPLALLLAEEGSRGHTVGPSSGVSPLHYLLSQSRGIVHYLRLAAWPTPLIVDYGEDRFHGVGQWIWCGVFVSGLLILSLAALRFRPKLGFPGAAFFLLLAPTSSLVGGTRQMWAEHRMYLPLACLTVLLAAGLWRIVGQRSLAAFLALTVAATVALAQVAVARNRAYASELRLYAETAARRPGNAYAQGNYGFALERAGRTAEAKDRFEAAIRLKPDYAQAHFNLGVVLAGESRLGAAIEEYRLALRFEPDYADAHNNLGVSLAQTGLMAEAEREFAAAVRLRPDFAEARQNLASARAQLGK